MAEAEAEGERDNPNSDPNPIQALQIMNLRNFVTNIMITKFFRETRYQYNDHEVWGWKLVTNIMITKFLSINSLPR